MPAPSRGESSKTARERARRPRLLGNGLEVSQKLYRGADVVPRAVEHFDF